MKGGKPVSQLASRQTGGEGRLPGHVLVATREQNTCIVLRAADLHLDAVLEGSSWMEDASVQNIGRRSAIKDTYGNQVPGRQRVRHLIRELHEVVAVVRHPSRGEHRARKATQRQRKKKRTHDTATV